LVPGYEPTEVAEPAPRDHDHWTDQERVVEDEVLDVCTFEEFGHGNGEVVEVGPRVEGLDHLERAPPGLRERSPGHGPQSSSKP
jgi:hypothetical protein